MDAGWPAAGLFGVIGAIRAAGVPASLHADETMPLQAAGSRAGGYRGAVGNHGSLVAA